MTAIRKMKLYQILLIILAFTLSNCMSEDYNLKDGVNTDMSLGGDSLSFPIGNTKKILLGSLVDGQSIDILKKSLNGDYLLQLKDSMNVKMDAINPVDFTIAPISIAPINTTLADVKIPAFNINPINIASDLPIPHVDLSSYDVPAISSVNSYSQPLAGGSGVKKLTKTDNSVPSKIRSIDLIPVGPVHISRSELITQSMNFNLAAASNDLKKINTIQLTSSKVTIKFDKTSINAMNFASKNDAIKSFSIVFPNEYFLSSKTGANTSISTNLHEFRIDNLDMSTTDVYIATFNIDRLEMGGIDQSLGFLNYTGNTTYSIDYEFSGTSNDPTILTQNINVGLSVTSSPRISDMDIQTKDFSVLVPSGSNGINQSISIPKEVSKVNTLTFDANANLLLSISNPGISPFNFKSGNCIIQLPKKFIFKQTTGLNLATNILTIPYNQLLGYGTNIGISGMNINQSVPVGSNSITLVDNLSYDIVGLQVNGQNLSVSTINAMSGKKLDIVGTITGLSVNNASVETKSISFNIPSQSSNIDINQLVSKDVKKLYTLTLKTPSVLEFKIGISNLPTGIDSVFFDNYTIQFPSFLKFKTGDLNSQNQLVLNEGFSRSNGFSKAITIQMIDFGTNGIDLTNGNIEIHQSVTMSGSAYVKGANLNSRDISSVVITPTVTIGTMSIARIEGKVSTAIDPVSQSISLNLPSFLTNGASVLDIVNPVMSFEIGNSMGIPVNLDLTLTPKKNGVVVTDGIIKTQIAINQASILGQTTWSRYWISNYCVNRSAGFDTINVALPKLLKYVPDQIEISAIPTITGNKQTVDLYSIKNQIDLKYAVNVPLSFGKDFVIQYMDTIADLQKQLKDVFKYAHQANIIITIENSIPLELSLEATALTTTNGLVDGVTISAPAKIKPGNANGTAQTSKITISLKETKTGALEFFDALKLNINAKNNSTVAGISLNADQYLKLDLKVLIPNGLTINPSSTK